ncbi:MAG: universal stress protein, partial [Myxococcaceae bacterium]
MSIVVGIDFSEHSRQAARVAAVLARMLGTRLELIHVIDPWIEHAFTGDLGRVTGPAEQHLQAERDALVRSFGVDVRAEVRVGIPDEEIARKALDAGSTLVVTSALGWRTEAHWRLGGIAERLARHTRVPFLTVRDPRPFLEWSEGKRPLRVMVGDDLGRISNAALQWLSVLRHAGPCEVVVAHVYLPVLEHRRLGLSFAREREVQAVLEKEVQTRVEGQVPGGAQVRVEPGLGLATESLLDVAKEQGADLIVLGTHQFGTGRRLWQGSVSQAVLREAPTSVACVPLAASALKQPEIPPVRRVLVSTDFSDLGNQAIPHAYALAPEGGEVVLLSVVEISISDARSPQAPDAYPESRRQLEALVPASAVKRGIKTT